MELDWLQTFLAVVDHGGFTAASAQVHRSQSRVSAHIAALERELGVRLIDRSRRPATVTDAGKLLAVHARQILGDVGAARSAIGAIKALADRSIGLCTTPGIGGTLFPAVLTDLMNRHPDARVTLHEDAWPCQQRHGDEEFVVSVLPSIGHGSPTGRRRALWREGLRLLVRADHPVAGSGRVDDPGLLAAEPFVFGLMSGLTESAMTDLLARRGLGVRARLTVDLPDTLVAMVHAGLGVGVVNSLALAGTDISGLVVVDVDDPAAMPVAGFDVVAHWYDGLRASVVGRDLHDAVMTSPTPVGAIDLRARGG